MNLFDIILKAQQEHKRCVLCTLVKTQGSTPQKAGAKMLVFADGSIAGTVGGGNKEYQVIQKALDLMKCNETTALFTLQEDTDTMEFFLEQILLPPNLYIFGGGHVGKALATLAQHFPFAITIIEPRTNLLSNETDYFRIIREDYLTSLSTLHFDEDTFSVITTSSHETDKELLIRLAQKPHAYLGLIGSTKKIESIKNYCLQNQYLTEEQLASIDMPIGIKIAAKTPEEIAVSILAKLIDVKNSRYK